MNSLYRITFAIRLTSFIFILSLLFTFNLNAQSTLTVDIIGKWEVNEVQFLEELTDQQQVQMEMLKEAFLKSTFEFKADHNFTFLFEFEDMKIEQAHWKYDKYKNKYVIQEWQDKDSDSTKLMNITIKQENGKTSFLLDETPIILEVVKVK